MKKGQTIAHSPRCKRGKCRGGCWKQKENKRIVESIREAKSRNIHQMIVGESMVGKSAASLAAHKAIQDARKIFWTPEEFAFEGKKFLDANRLPSLHEYQKAKEERIAQVTAQQDRGNFWELFGRLTGMALHDGDESFYRFLEGIHAAYNNGRHGRPALGGRKA